MKKLICLALLLGFVGSVSAEWVSGYLRRDGTWVDGYYRTERNDTVYDNRSYTPSCQPQPVYTRPTLPTYQAPSQNQSDFIPLYRSRYGDR